MSNYKIIESEEISNTDVLNLIKNKSKDQELTYREEKIKDYLKDITKLNKTNLKAARKELEDLNIPRLENKHIVKILDLLPKNGTELRAIISHSGTVIVDENVTKILDVLKKYRK